ncbi:MAG: DUF3365 domain-containing protein [Thermodesulfovibrionales bacterium]
MNDPEKIKAQPFKIERYGLVLAVVWTIVIATSLVWHVVETKKMTLEEAQIQARATYEKDIVYRRWNAGHGGVYVPVTKETQPNPYLSDVPERDITTPSGKALTLMNPAYMTRQAHELEKRKLGVRGHITSLNPIRPENAPDPWETEALRAFGRGEAEINSVKEIEGKKYMRLMRPLITEKGCLRCHSKQGYHEGDIRGGISVSIPMEFFLAIERRQILTFALVYGLLWMVGLIGIGLGTQRLMRTERKRKRAEEALLERTAQLEEANKELEAFSYSVSHDLRAPLRHISGFAKLLEKEAGATLNETNKEYLTTISDSAKRMDKLIDDLLTFSRIGRLETRKTRVNPKQLIQEVIDELQEEIKGRDLIWKIGELPHMYGDRSMLRLVFINLISNALKYTRTREQAIIEIGCEPKSDKNIFFIKDNGVGFDMQYADKLFSVFQRLHRQEDFEGTGIGLANVRRIIRRHGGETRAEGFVGKGATFYFSFPKSMEDSV